MYILYLNYTNVNESFNVKTELTVINLFPVQSPSHSLRCHWSLVLFIVCDCQNKTNTYLYKSVPDNTSVSISGDRFAFGLLNIRQMKRLRVFATWQEENYNKVQSRYAKHILCMLVTFARWRHGSGYECSHQIDMSGQLDMNHF